MGSSVDICGGHALFQGLIQKYHLTKSAVLCILWQLKMKRITSSDWR